MAATAWSLYTAAKKGLGNGTIQLGVNTLYIELYKGSSNASTATLIAGGSVTNEVTNGNGYTTGGKALTSVTWTTSGTGVVLSAASTIWTASGGNITSVQYAVIRNSADKLLCWSKLSTSVITVTQDNTLTVAMNATGVFALS